MIETLLENSTKMNMLKILRFPWYPSSMCCGLCSFISRPALFERKRGKYSKKFQNRIFIIARCLNTPVAH